MNTTTSTSSTQQATPTAEEKALENNELQMSNFMMPFQQKMYEALAGGNIIPILQGQSPQAQGVGGITDQQTQNMITQGLRSLYPQLQSNGILNSGTAAQAGLTTAADIANQNAQFNVSAAQNLFNLATGGQSNLQSQAQANNSALGQQLAGLRTITGTQSTTSNPFLNSFFSSLGKVKYSPANVFSIGGGS